MDPSLAEIERQGSKASESTTEGEGEKFHLREKAARAAHPGEQAAHLYCIGDETLIRNLGGESCLAIARMKHFGALQT